MSKHQRILLGSKGSSFGERLKWRLRLLGLRGMMFTNLSLRGNLGILDLSLVNLTLLANWIWRFFKVPLV